MICEKCGTEFHGTNVCPGCKTEYVRHKRGNPLILSPNKTNNAKMLRRARRNKLLSAVLLTVFIIAIAVLVYAIIQSRL